MMALAYNNSRLLKAREHVVAADFHPLLHKISQACTIYGVRSLQDGDVLGQISRSEVVSLLQAVCGNADALDEVGQRSYLHANGFWKVPLLDTAAGLRIRMHYWPSGIMAEENIHAHRWYMASTIVFGCLESQRFVACESGVHGAESLACFRYMKARSGMLGAERESLGQKSVRCVGSDVRVTGDVYGMAPGQLHRITKRDGLPTMTLMVQSAAVSSENLMYTSDAVGEPSVSVQPAGARQLWCLLQEVLHVCKEVA